MNNFPKDGFELYQIYSLRHSYREKEEQIVSSLADMDFPKIIEGVRQIKKKEVNRDLPIPLRLKDINETLVDQNVTFLYQAKTLRDIAASSDRVVRPILYYYSAVQLLAFFTYSLVRIDQPHHHHGLKLTNLQDCNDAVIRFMDSGFLPRVLDVFGILGVPSRFSPIIVRNKEIERYEGALCRSNKSVSVADLVNADFGGFHLSHDIRYYILLFVASNFARYKPAIWNKILFGRGTKLYLAIQKAYSEFDAFFYKVMAALEFIIANDLKILEFAFRHSGDSLRHLGVEKLI